MPEAQKSPAQIQVEALNRKRKPLITFESKDIEVLKKKHAEEINALNRQLSGLQTDLSAKEARIQELEDRIAVLQKPADTGPAIALTEAVPGQPGSRRQRQAAKTAPSVEVKNVTIDPAIQKHLDENPDVILNVLKENAPAVAAILADTEPPKTPPAAAPVKPVKPGDGIEEDDA